MQNSNEALREALKAMLDECCNLCDVPNQMTESGHTCSWRDRWSGCQSQAIDKALAALALPYRQCDVGTAEEQTARYDKFCNTNRTVEKCCTDCPALGTADCELLWAQMPYNESEATDGK